LGSIISIALYGSLARNQDKLYSDIELFCIVEVQEMDGSSDWIYGEGKAETNQHQYLF
jgi:predicted nucleotidyltransferase